MRNRNYLVTAQGLEKIKEDIQLKLKKKEALTEVLNKTRDAGDLSENDGYALAMEDFKNNEGELARLNDLLSNAKIVKGKNDGKVQIGDAVLIVDGKGNEKKFTVVGENEGNPLEGKISHNSPLGKGLLGKKEKDTFEFKTPKEVIKYTIKKVLD